MPVVSVPYEVAMRRNGAAAYVRRHDLGTERRHRVRERAVATAGIEYELSFEPIAVLNDVPKECMPSVLHALSPRAVCLVVEVTPLATEAFEDRPRYGRRIDG